MLKDVIEYQIIDREGVIYSSPREEEMWEQFYRMQGDDSTEQWDGDLKLVAVLAIYK